MMRCVQQDGDMRQLHLRSVQLMKCILLPTRAIPAAPAGVVGTEQYVAPEVLRGKLYGKAADLFSAGAALYHMLNGAPPNLRSVYAGSVSSNEKLLLTPARVSSALANVDRCCSTPKLAWNRVLVHCAAIFYSGCACGVVTFLRCFTFQVRTLRHVSMAGNDLMRRLMDPTAANRPTAAKALAHPWFAGFDWRAFSLRTLSPPYLPRRQAGMFYGSGNTPMSASARHRAGHEAAFA